jgi:hypothetical protein
VAAARAQIAISICSETKQNLLGEPLGELALATIHVGVVPREQDWSARRLVARVWRVCVGREMKRRKEKNSKSFWIFKRVRYVGEKSKNL